MQRHVAAHIIPTKLNPFTNWKLSYFRPLLTGLRPIAANRKETLGTINNERNVDDLPPPAVALLHHSGADIHFRTVRRLPR